MRAADGEDTENRTVPSAATAVDSRLVSAASYELVVVAGPDVGKTLTIDGKQEGPVYVGQSVACELRLTDPRASRRHASFELADRQLRLLDAGSTNGTFVQGVSVVEALLQGDELVRLGETTLRVTLLSPSTVVAISSAAHFGRILGESAEMRRLYPLLERLAMSDVPVVIEGETGTGKELVAEALHECGPRAAGPFVVFDCTAVAPTLIESELFGHQRGAFTGAVGDRKGVFEQAHGGTLLIDEIGDLPMALQPKLLRVLERSEVRRVGGESARRVDVRVLAATRRNLDREVQGGRFRDDLFHRLAVTRAVLPPLRRRKGDVALLARAFGRAGTGTTLPESLLRSWEEYAWPGNVRELRNAVARRMALGELQGWSETVSDDDAAPSSVNLDAVADGSGVLEGIVSRGLPLNVARQQVLEELERRYVGRVLAEHGGNITRAAEASGIARRQFQRVKRRLRP
jgi:two-component system, NtrC family, response regulator HydG